ncbi:MAG: LPS assembly lipoprotein LptE [Gemmatimonadaceae bacterium]
MLTTSLVGCLYGFAGGGLPKHIRTVAIVPFENETPSPEVQRELYDQMRRDFRGRLGLRDASETRADAIVRGTITRYDADVPIAYSANRTQATTARRKLQIAVDVEIIDQTTGRVLWSRRGLIGEAEYAERAEAEGRLRAVQEIVGDMVEGAQSQW